VLTDVAGPAAVGALAKVAEQRFGHVDNMDAPVDGPGQVHGSYPGPVLRHSVFTRLIGRLPRPASWPRPRSIGCGVPLRQRRQRRNR
jgi:hypothetical protein